MIFEHDSGDVFQYIIENENVQVFVKNNKIKEGIIPKLGDVYYRRAKRVLAGYNSKIDWWERLEHKVSFWVSCKGFFATLTK